MKKLSSVKTHTYKVANLMVDIVEDDKNYEVWVINKHTGYDIKTMVEFFTKADGFTLNDVKERVSRDIYDYENKHNFNLECIHKGYVIDDNMRSIANSLVRRFAKC